MITTIARREIVDTWREGQVRLAAGILFGLLLLALLVGVQHWQKTETARAAAQAEDTRVWLSQGRLNPHSAAHFGRYIFKPSGPLAFVDEGINPYAGSAVYLEAHSQTPTRARPAADAAFLSVFGELTPALVLQLLVPLMIILVAFAGFSGERESGTFRQVLSMGVPRRALRGKVKRAESLFRQSLGLNPDHVEAWFGLGRTLEDLGEAESALGCYLNVLQRRPGHALALGHYLGLVKDDADAELLANARAVLRSAEHGVTGEFNDAQHDEVVPALQETPVARPLDGALPYQAAGVARPASGEEGELAGRVGGFIAQPAVSQKAGYEPALRPLNAGGEGDSALAESAQALICYGLAKYHDRRGEFLEAAQAGLAANAARRRKAGPLDRAALSARIDHVVDTYTPDFFTLRRHHGVGTDQPVFIVGLPRSGTTLTEQIIAAHPLLHGAGELPDLARLAVRSLEGRDADPWQAAALLEDEMRSRELAGVYLRALRDGAPKGRLRMSDKSPLNFFQLAFAAVLFPGARVIHCRRDARDNALSIWMENFNADQRYATDFGELAFFTAQYRRLMAHWHHALPLRILDMQYEDTVENVEAQARKLMAFLDVPWDARCLDFHRSERAVQTPSRWQVRQPIYTRSVARWRNYVQHLPELEIAFRGMDEVL